MNNLSYLSVFPTQRVGKSLVTIKIIVKTAIFVLVVALLLLLARVIPHKSGMGFALVWFEQKRREDDGKRRDHFTTHNYTLEKLVYPTGCGSASLATLRGLW